MCLRQCNGTNQITIGFSRFQVANMPGVAISLIVFLLCTPLLFIYGICVCICLYKCVYIKRNILFQFVRLICPGNILQGYVCTIMKTPLLSEHWVNVYLSRMVACGNIHTLRNGCSCGMLDNYQKTRKRKIKGDTFV